MRLLLAIACVLHVICTSMHAQHRTLDRLPTVISAGGDTVDLLAVSEDGPIILVRHLGVTCSHCVEQVRALLRYHAVSGPLPCTVYAISSDDVQTCDTMARKLAIDSTALRLCSDVDDACANALGCVIIEKDGTITDLHLVMVLYRRRVLFEHYSITPLMSFGDVMGVVSSIKR